MIPRQPPKRAQLGFLYLPPYRVQGLSIAGEETVIQIPELGLCFDIGLCPRAALASPHIALSHGHMDHAAGLAYYFSQRYFQGMGVGTIVCHTALAQPIHNVMNAWVDVEGQKTPYKVVPLAFDEHVEIKNNIFLRGFAVSHTETSLGYTVIERRSKLKPELVGWSQEKIKELKHNGQEVTQIHEIPLVCFTGDTMWGPHFDRPDVLNAKILITECTFLESSHKDRATIGRHLHLDDILKILERSTAEAIILTHMSRRTNLLKIREVIDAKIPARDRDRVHILMDRRANLARYGKQTNDATVSV